MMTLSPEDRAKYEAALHPHAHNYEELRALAVQAGINILSIPYPHGMTPRDLVSELVRIAWSAAKIEELYRLATACNHSQTQTQCKICAKWLNEK